MDRKSIIQSNKIVAQYTLFGVIFGACFPLASLMLDAFLLHDQPVAFETLFFHNPIHFIVALAPIVLGGVFYLVGAKQAKLYKQVISNRIAQEELKSLAVTDSLTGLGNRLALTQAVSEHVQRMQSSNVEPPIHILLIDFDKFKFINDTLGHHVGDALLVAYAKRIIPKLSKDQFLFRLGGDEFVLMLHEHLSSERMEEIATLLLECFDESFEIEGMLVSTGGSIGISSVLPADKSHSEVLARADLALYKAKSEFGSSFAFFADNLAVKVKRQMAMRHSISMSLSEQDFFIEYLPIVDIESKNTLGFEALARWYHPDHGMVTPSEFIEVAESTSLIIQLGEHVLNMACSEAIKWPDEVSLSVNISSVQFKHRLFFEQVVSVLEKTGLDPSRLIIEVTESIFTTDIGFTTSVFDRLRALGVRFTLDDFGAGFTSINHFRKLRMDYLKLHKTFAQKLLSDPREASIILSIAEIARLLGLQTIAGGVETEAELEMMKTVGVKLSQGYLFSKPMASEKIVPYLAENDPDLTLKHVLLDQADEDVLKLKSSWIASN